MEKQDITLYSDNELSLIVFNDEYFYNHRHRRDLIPMLQDMFIFTDAQLKVLEEDLEEDLIIDQDKEDLLENFDD
jgi:hypothetical protein